MKSVCKQVQPLLKQHDSNSESISPPAAHGGEIANVAKAGLSLPQPKRRRKRSKADRGLPGDAELARLATVYLETQRKYWPKLADAGLLPVPSPEVIHQMVDDFKERHRGAAAGSESLQQFKTFCAELAGSYNRFSCDNSSPTSILNQLSNALDKAKTEERFIPSAYVYADYSVIRKEEAHQRLSTRPIDIDEAKTYLTDLRETLDQDIPVAAEAIRALTGPIRVRQEQLPGRKRARWVASFQPNLPELLRRVSPPETKFDNAISKSVSESNTVEVVIDKLPKYELHAAEFQKLQQSGTSKTALASAFGLSPKTVTQTLEFAKTGEGSSGFLRADGTASHPASVNLV